MASTRAMLIDRIRLLGSGEVLRLGQLNQEIVRHWSQDEHNLDVVLTGDRRQHYIERHPDVLSVEQYLIDAVLDPDEVHRNKTDLRVAIFYKQVDERHYLRVAVLMQPERSPLQHSILSIRLASPKELRKGQGRSVWKKG